MPGALYGIVDDEDDDDGDGNNGAHCEESVEAAGVGWRWGVGVLLHCVSTFNFQMALSRNNVLLFFLFPLLLCALSRDLDHVPGSTCSVWA